MSVTVDVDGARKVLRLVDALEDLDDVQNVYSNVDIPDGILAELNCGGKIPDENVLTALRLMCREVMPRFH